MIEEREQQSPTEPAENPEPQNPPYQKIVLVGLMGAGKSVIGRRLARRLRWTFYDADTEIEKAAGCSISDFFATHGEAAFRQGERQVIQRLLDDPHPCVIATGGGAYMDEITRASIAERGTSIWLRADLDTLVERTSRRNTRPLLNTGDPRQILSDLIDRRYPIYAEADVTIDSIDGPLDKTLNAVIKALKDYGAEL